MGATAIEWTDYTFNPWRGCTKVSAACRNCYAEKDRSVRIHGIGWGPKAPRRMKADSGWNAPEAWNRKAEREGVRFRVFVASLADVFEGAATMPAESWPLVQEARARLWALIEATPNLDWLLLTKRPENVLEMVPRKWVGQPSRYSFGRLLHAYPGNWPPNVWIGTTVEDQASADKRIPELLKIPAAVRFLSCEPLLGGLELLNRKGRSALGPQNEGQFLNVVECGHSSTTYGISWVIAGGESGHGARPMHPDWVRSLRDQCVAAGVPFLFKQWGKWAPLNDGPGGDVDCTRYSKPASAAGFFDYNDRWNGPDVPDGQRLGLMGSEGRMRTNPFRQTMGLVGKKAAGRLLDGRTWDEVPSV